MRAAEGRWYEAMIYEMILDLSIDSPTIQGVAGKGADARRRWNKATLGQNGLFYSRSGDIKIRGNGQDLAEIDLLMAGSDRVIMFGEIVTSQANLRELEEEIEYKKGLLGYLFGTERIRFILISSVDLSKMSMVKRLLRDESNAFISTASCEGVRKLIGPSEWLDAPRMPRNQPKLISLNQFVPVRRMDYRELHDRKRQHILDAISAGEPLACIGKSEGQWSPVRKVILGALHPNAARLLAEEKVLKVKEHRLSGREMRERYLKAVLAVDFPECEPVLYLRTRRGREYLKMAWLKNGTFRCESSRSKKMLGFFLWLESVKPSLGTGITRRLLDSGLFDPRPGALERGRPLAKSRTLPTIERR
ncbi:MAG: hypothetical protein QHG99_07510 [Methanomicrobiales archaeon]|nr:hypothetical protein [Methanomicrobiales archaeon]